MFGLFGMHDPNDPSSGSANVMSGSGMDVMGSMKANSDFATQYQRQGGSAGGWGQEGRGMMGSNPLMSLFGRFGR